MKTMLILLALAGGVLCGILERQPTTACNADNCLRALRNPTRSVVAPAFCSSYTTATVTATTSLPTFATACGTGPTQSVRLSSACSCFQPVPTSYIQDGGFEDVSGGFPYLGPWSVTEIGTTTGQGGWSPGFNSPYMFGASLFGSNPSPSVFLTQTLTTKPGVKYSFSMHYRFDSGMDTCDINLTFPDGSTSVVSLTGLTPGTWYSTQDTFLGGGVELLTINPFCQVGAGGEIFIDDVEVS